MNDISTVLDEFESASKWARSLDVAGHAWNRPIAEGKATIAGIVSHLLNWDRYLIIYTIPSVLKGEDILFPEFNAFNLSAYEYAESGVKQERLLAEFADTRMELCALLRSIGEADLLRAVSVNGASHCPHTGSPYSLLYVMGEFADHDRHHQKQIELAASARSVSS
ncbi:DinB family protein [Paenibacillus humicus]|uniref:DinB family protein n=1 Tax=Paenibacillus humicus TaxID=412861 RepID=UPI003F1783CC